MKTVEPSKELKIILMNDQVFVFELDRSTYTKDAAGLGVNTAEGKLYFFPWNNILYITNNNEGGE